MLLLLLLAAGGGLYYLSRPDRLVRIAAAAIERLTGADVHVVGAQLSRDGTIHLERLAVRLPGQTGTEGRLLEAEQVFLKPDIWSLLRGSFIPRSILLRRPLLHVIEDLEAEQFTFQKLLPSREDQSKPWRPGSLPDVYIQQGQLQFGQWDQDGFEPLGSLDVNGTLTERPRRQGVYDLVLRQTNGGASAPRILGSFDLNSLKSSAVVERFRLNQPHRNFLPKRLRDWWDQYEPQGSFPIFEVGYDPDRGVGLQARIAIKNGSLRFPLLNGVGPVHETDPTIGAVASLTDVAGQITVENETIRIEHLTGVVEGIRYTIDGTIYGFEPDAPFVLKVRTDEFDLQENPRYLVALPSMVQKHYHRFSPAGSFKVEAELSRAKSGGMRSYHGRLDLINARARYYKFPYPLRQLNGSIHFTHEKIEVVDLRCRGPVGGEIVMNGTITPPGSSAAVQMKIICTDMPIDEHLIRAMNDKHRKALRLFLDEDAQRALVRQGLIRSSNPDIQLAAASTPVFEDPELFDLGGRTSLVINIDREYGEDKQHHVTTKVAMAGLRGIYKHWPYPLQTTSGQIVIAPDHVLIEKVGVRGLTGSVGVVEGRVERDPQQRVRPDLHLRDVRISMDELLLASIKSPQDQWIRTLHLAGWFEGQGDIFQRDDGEIDFDLHGEVAEASSRPNGGDLMLSDLAGAFAVGRRRLQLDDLSGRRGEGRLDVTGQVQWSGDQLETDLRFRADGLELGRPLLDLLPAGHPARERLSGLLDRYQPSGRFNGELAYHAISGAGDESYTLMLEPQVLAFDLRGRRVHFDQASGMVFVRPDGLELKDLVVTFEHGLAHIEGQMKIDPELEADLRFTVEANRIDDTTRAFLPPAVERLLDDLEWEGGYRVQTGRLIRRPEAAGEPVMDFEALMRLEGASGIVGVPIAELDGTVDIKVVRQPAQIWPQIDLRLDAERLRVSNRLIEGVKMRMATGDRPNTLRLEELHGWIYGGSLVGTGSVQLGRPAAYRFDLQLDGVQLGPFLDPLNVGSGANNAVAAEDSGKLTADLSLESIQGRPKTRQGRGALEVRNAALWEKPLVHALLHAANLTLPTQSSFDRVSARYLIMGDKVAFESIRFESPAHAIVGEGDMDYPTQRISLKMVIRNPNLDLGPLSEMVNVFKDELVAIEVKGTLTKPKAKAISFKGIRRSWLEIFGNNGHDPKSGRNRPDRRVESPGKEARVPKK